MGNFFTGGLNLQIEHHLFPAVCFVHYPAIAKIVAEEAAKIGVPYASYRTLPGIMVEFFKFVKDMGTAVGTRTYYPPRHRPPTRNLIHHFFELLASYDAGHANVTRSVLNTHFEP